MDGNDVIDDLAAATVYDLLDAMAQRRLSAVDLTRDCLARIAAVDSQVHAVLALDPTAMEQAAAADASRAAGTAGALCGIPVLIKDNVAVTGLPTTAGSRALAGSRPTDAPLVHRLRGAGAVVLGKTNLSEWANFRSRESTSGWSAVGGQTRNPHVLDRNPSGSSSGSAAAAAAGFAPLTVGTETDGSIVSPAGACGVVGFKPGLGVVPGTGVVPISSRQDVAGPITRCVADAAALFEVLAATTVGPLDVHALRGARIGVWQPADLPAPCVRVLDEVVGVLAGAGASTHAVHLDVTELEATAQPALLAEFRDELDRYLGSAPGSLVRSTADLVEFNRADPVELSLFGQDNLEAALTAPPLTDDGYRAHRDRASVVARSLVDGALAAFALDAILTVSNEPAWPIDHSAGDDILVATSSPAAVAGYPTISVPAGFEGPLPIGVSLIGGIGSEARLLALAFAFEQATRARRPPGLLASVD